MIFHKEFTRKLFANGKGIPEDFYLCFGIMKFELKIPRNSLGFLVRKSWGIPEEFSLKLQDLKKMRKIPRLFLKIFRREILMISHYLGNFLGYFTQILLPQTQGKILRNSQGISFFFSLLPTQRSWNWNKWKNSKLTFLDNK